MNIIGPAIDKYQQGLQNDPLAQLAENVGLQVNTPEAAQKLRTMGQAVAQEATRAAQVQTADDVDKSVTAWKQSFFQGKV